LHYTACLRFTHCPRSHHLLCTFLVLSRTRTTRSVCTFDLDYVVLFSTCRVIALFTSCIATSLPRDTRLTTRHVLRFTRFAAFSTFACHSAQAHHTVHLHTSSYSRRTVSTYHFARICVLPRDAGRVCFSHPSSRSLSRASQLLGTRLRLMRSPLHLPRVCSGTIFARERLSAWFSFRKRPRFAAFAFHWTFAFARSFGFARLHGFVFFFFFFFLPVALSAFSLYVPLCIFLISVCAVHSLYAPTGREPRLHGTSTNFRRFSTRRFTLPLQHLRTFY